MQSKATVKEAIEMLNEQHCHPNGFHLFFVRDELLKDLWDQKEIGGDAAAHLMRQTYDWKFHKPDREKYTVTLSAADMEVVAAAMEVYNRAVYTRYLEPALKNIIMGLPKDVSQ